MIIFLYGQDSYGVWRKQKEIIDHYLVPDGVAGKKKETKYALKIFEGGDFAFQDLKNEIETNSIFKEKKLVVLKDVFSDKNFKEEFLKKGESFLKSDSLILICEGGDVDKRDGLFKFLQKKAKTQEFPPLEGEKLENWVKKEFNNFKTEIEPRAVKKLIVFAGNDIWQLENEIKKLVCYSDKKKITEKEVQDLVRPKIENDIFETIDSLSEGKREKALYLIHKHLEKGDSPLYLLSMINFQFRNLLEIKDLIEKNIPYYGILKKSGLHPFVIKKTYYQSQRFTFQKLKKIYLRIFQADLSIKTGKIGAEDALDLLISNI